MNNRTNKILAFLALLAEFIIFFMLFGKIRNVFVASNSLVHQKSIYVLLILAIIISVFLFILSILASYKKNSEDEYSKDYSDLLNEKSEKQDSEKENIDEESLNVENYSNKILPKDSSKLDLVKYTEKILSNIAKEFDIVQGLFFIKEKDSDVFNITGKYAYFGDEDPKSFKLGETISGQVAKNKTVLNLKEIPENYVTILSGLGSSSPNNLIIIPVVLEDKTVAIIELASFKKFKNNFGNLFAELSEQIGKELMKY